MEKYKLIKNVGKGSFGHAVLVKNSQESNNNNLYVIKIINIKKMNTKQREDALNEIKVLKNLHSPFIIRYKESFLKEN